ncbi:WD40 repeat-like protein [Rhizopogon vinicolor AM-OR11-026]|uniref:WD40 repeat-like protein n=1 Tax=Rhizopogon vinicolor AM-OR11-026 TaxID=1314800 RepID=A0A1B7MRA2_9AGAM|nr:WD40 repeat-like protein [Rhizopogon vinicolor AM-OR11-026]
MQCKGPTPKYNFEGHKNDILDFVFLHDNVHIVSGSEDGTMRKWDCDTGLIVGEPWKGEGGNIWALALSPDGKTIACGRRDGRVQRWDTNGKLVEGVWIGHSRAVWSLSWSPSGGHIASGSEDGIILIRNAGSGEVDVGPIETKQGGVGSVAYSPSGDRIASGGSNQTICIWDNKTGKLLVDPIEDLGNCVTSVVWSSDSSKLYSASDKFARVFDSISGTLLHRFEHDHSLHSVALSPKHNALACVGYWGVAQLWDTESHKLLGQPSRQEYGKQDDGKHLDCVSFSQDGKYLAYGGEDKRITLWTVKDIAPRLAASMTDATQQETPSKSPSSYLDVDATKPFAHAGVNDITEEGRDDPYDNFFQYPSLRSASSDSSPKRRLWNIFIPSVFRSPENESISLKERLKRSFFTLHALSNPLLRVPANNGLTEPKPQEKVTARYKNGKHDNDVDLPNCSADTVPGANHDKVEQREEPPIDVDAPPPDGAFSAAKSDSNEIRALWKWLLRARGKEATSVKRTSAKMTRNPSPEVVEVRAARGFQRFVAYKPKHKTKKSQAPTTTANKAVPRQRGQYSQGAGGPSSHISQSHNSESSPSHFVTTHDVDDDSDSDSSIQGTCNKLLDKICFPRGHYYY